MSDLFNQFYAYLLENAFLLRMVGITGFCLYILSYILLQFEYIDGGQIGYSVLNTMAASMVLISLIVDFNLASAMIQITWIVVGVVGIRLRILRMRGDQRTERFVRLGKRHEDL
ncbi:MAG: hypothetical protein AAF826_02770 [Pseudomonadota bacterium]